VTNGTCSYRQMRICGGKRCRPRTEVLWQNWKLYGKPLVSNVHWKDNYNANVMHHFQCQWQRKKCIIKTTSISQTVCQCYRHIIQSTFSFLQYLNIPRTGRLFLKTKCSGNPSSVFHSHTWVNILCLCPSMLHVTCGFVHYEYKFSSVYYNKYGLQYTAKGVQNIQPQCLFLIPI